MRDTIIFDFDGTLIDSAPGILATFAEVLSDAGLTPAVALDRSLIGPPLRQTMSKLVGELIAADDRLLSQLVENFKQRYDVIGVAHTPAYNQSGATLQALQEHGHTLYLATNKRATPTLALVEKFGWENHFRRVYCIDSHQPPYRDKTAMLEHLLEENHLSADRCLYVGDTTGDYIAAKACGLSFAAVLWGYGTWEPASEQERSSIHHCATLHELSALACGS